MITNKFIQRISVLAILAMLVGACSQPPGRNDDNNTDLNGNTGGNNEGQQSVRPGFGAENNSGTMDITGDLSGIPIMAMTLDERGALVPIPGTRTVTNPQGFFRVSVDLSVYQHVFLMSLVDGERFLLVVPEQARNRRAYTVDRIDHHSTRMAMQYIQRYRQHLHQHHGAGQGHHGSR